MDLAFWVILGRKLENLLRLGKTYIYNIYEFFCGYNYPLSSFLHY